MCTYNSGQKNLIFFSALVINCWIYNVKINCCKQQKWNKMKNESHTHTMWRWRRRWLCSILTIAVIVTMVAVYFKYNICEYWLNIERLTKSIHIAKSSIWYDWSGIFAKSSLIKSNELCTCVCVCVSMYKPYQYVHVNKFLSTAVVFLFICTISWKSVYGCNLCSCIEFPELILAMWTKSLIE